MQSCLHAIFHVVKILYLHCVVLSSPPTYNVQFIGNLLDSGGQTDIASAMYCGMTYACRGVENCIFFTSDSGPCSACNSFADMSETFLVFT